MLKLNRDLCSETQSKNVIFAVLYIRIFHLKLLCLICLKYPYIIGYAVNLKKNVSAGYTNV